MQLKSGSAASKGSGAFRTAFTVGDWELDKLSTLYTNGFARNHGSIPNV
ncbi:MAG: hypothetical protein V7L22_16320 [Nostoc sp.]